MFGSPNRLEILNYESGKLTKMRNSHIRATKPFRIVIISIVGLRLSARHV